MINKDNPHLGGCYHTGLAYALGYDANGELELCSKLFTTLDSGIDGGALSALNKHRRLFCPDRDVEQFIVEMKPVKILHRVPESPYGLDNTPGCCHCEEKADENCCCHEYDESEGDWCKECGYYTDTLRYQPSLLCHCPRPEDDTCLACNSPLLSCCCDDETECDEECCTSCSCDTDNEIGDICGACDEEIEYCTCDDDVCLGCEELFDNCSCDDGYEDELCQELVSETFQPMNAFARARWMRAQQKGN